MSTSCMHIRVALVVLISGFLRAQSGVPAFRADRVLPSGGGRSVQLVPGMLVSIYGTDLGPQQGCTGQADTHRIRRRGVAGAGIRSPEIRLRLGSRPTARASWC